MLISNFITFWITIDSENINFGILWKLVFPVGGHSYVRTKFTKFPSQMMDILSYYLPNQRIICIIHDILVKYQQRIQKFEGVFSKIGRSMHKKYQRHNKILFKYRKFNIPG
jgi:hypothetical protein